MSELAIEAVDVSKKFLLGRRSTSLKDKMTGFSSSKREEFWAFRNVSMEVPKGSLVGIIGRNGSGKSTLLRTLCGVYRPTSGHVRVQGRVTALLELGAGFHGELTGRENIYMNAAVVGLDRSYMDSVMDEIVDMADIGSFIDAPIETYSSGMRARLGFAVSIQMQPEVLLADEITAVGDITFKQHGARRMAELRDRGTTIVQVTHNLSMLEKGADKVLWLHHGEARRFGDPDEILDEYRAAAKTDRSGRMIDGAVPAPPGAPAAVASKQKARKEKQAAITKDLEANDKNASWFDEVDFSGPDGAPLKVGAPATISIGLRPESVRSGLRLKLRVLAAGGAPTGYGYDSGSLDNLLDASGVGALAAHVDPLTLASGRYNLRIELHAGRDIVASKTTAFEVSPAKGALTMLPATWRVTAAH